MPSRVEFLFAENEEQGEDIDLVSGGFAPLSALFHEDHINSI